MPHVSCIDPLLLKLQVSRGMSAASAAPQSVALGMRSISTEIWGRLAFLATWGYDPRLVQSQLIRLTIL